MRLTASPNYWGDNGGACFYDPYRNEVIINGGIGYDAYLACDTSHVQGVGKPFLRRLRFDPIGLDDIGIDNTLVQVYPNPANTSFYIKIPQHEEILSLKIIDMQGRTVHKQANLQFQERVDIRNLVSGIYFVEIHLSDNKNYIQKLIIAP